MLKNKNYLYGRTDVQLPLKLNVGDYILKQFREFADSDAYMNAANGNKLTYRDIVQQAMNLAVSLTHLGVRKGEVVAMCTEPREDVWGAILGVICTGAIFTPYNPGYGEVEMKHVTSISKPKYLICSPTAYKSYEKIFKSINLKRIILFNIKKVHNTILFDDLTKPKNDLGDNVFENAKLIRNVDFEEFEPIDVEGHDEALIMYSSGTTGMPKGVVISHYNIVATFAQKPVTYIGYKLLSLAPWFHAMGFVGTLLSFVAGKCVITLPKFEVDIYLRTIEKHKVDQIITVPPMLVAIAKWEKEYDLSSVKKISCGAAPLYAETSIAIKQKFPNAAGVTQGYGMTETTIAIATEDFDFGKESKPGSVGTIVAGTVLKVVDIETRKVLGVRQAGEICVKGPQIMKGYLGKTKGEDFDDEGFFKTGDVGYYEDDGRLFIVDRLKELIKYKANQVPPAEIEALLLKHEAVRDAGVIGIPDQAAGEVPFGFVVLQPGKTATEKELQQFVAERLSNPKRLRGGVRFVSEIPKTPSGKVLRKELKKIARNHRSKL